MAGLRRVARLSGEHSKTNPVAFNAVDQDPKRVAAGFGKYQAVESHRTDETDVTTVRQAGWSGDFEILGRAAFAKQTLAVLVDEVDGQRELLICSSPRHPDPQTQPERVVTGRKFLHKHRVPPTPENVDLACRGMHAVGQDGSYPFPFTTRGLWGRCPLAP